jgi:hypothetical protein
MRLTGTMSSIQRLHKHTVSPTLLANGLLVLALIDYERNNSSSCLWWKVGLRSEAPGTPKDSTRPRPYNSKKDYLGPPLSPQFLNFDLTMSYSQWDHLKSTPIAQVGYDGFPWLLGGSSLPLVDPQLRSDDDQSANSVSTSSASESASVAARGTGNREPLSPMLARLPAGSRLFLDVYPLVSDRWDYVEGTVPSSLASWAVDQHGGDILTELTRNPFPLGDVRFDVAVAPVDDRVTDCAAIILRSNEFKEIRGEAKEAADARRHQKWMYENKHTPRSTLFFDLCRQMIGIPIPPPPHPTLLGWNSLAEVKARLASADLGIWRSRPCEEFARHLLIRDRRSSELLKFL